MAYACALRSRCDDEKGSRLATVHRRSFVHTMVCCGTCTILCATWSISTCLLGNDTSGRSCTCTRATGASEHGCLEDIPAACTRSAPRDHHTAPHVHVFTAHVAVVGRCAKEQRLVPLLPSKSRGGSMLIFSPDAVADRREELVRFLAAFVSPPVDRTELGGRLRTLGEVRRERQLIPPRLFAGPCPHLPCNQSFLLMDALCSTR